MNKDISRKKIYIYTILSGNIQKIIEIIIGIFSVPIALNYWGQEKYAIWTIINTIIVYLSVSNLGLNSAANILMTKENNINKKMIILKKTFIMSLVCSGVFFIMFFCYFFYSGNNIVNLLLGKISTNYIEETKIALFCMGVFFIINNLLAIIESIFFSFQKLYILKNFETIKKIIIFLNLFLIIYIKGNIVSFVIFNGIINLFFFLIEYIYIYIYILRKVKYDKSYNEKSRDTSYKLIFNTGINFFLIGFLTMFITNTDNLVISHFLGIQYVTSYSIAYKIFVMIFALIYQFVNAALPIISKEIGNSNWEWVNNKYNIGLEILAFVGGLVWLGTIIFAEDFILIWTNSSLNYSGIGVIFFLGGYSYLLAMGNLTGGVANMLNFSKESLLILLLDVIINISTSIYFSRYFGLTGVAMGTFIGALIASGIMYPYIIHKKTQIRHNYKFVLKHLIKILIPCILVGLIIKEINMKFYIRMLFGIMVVSLYTYFSFNAFSVQIKEMILIKILKFYNKKENI